VNKIYFEIELLAKANPTLVAVGDLYLCGPGDEAEIEFSNLEEWSEAKCVAGTGVRLRYEAMARAEDGFDFGAWSRGIRCYLDTSKGPVRVNARVEGVRVTDAR